MTFCQIVTNLYIHTGHIGRFFFCIY